MNFLLSLKWHRFWINWMQFLMDGIVNPVGGLMHELLCLSFRDCDFNIVSITAWLYYVIIWEIGLWWESNPRPYKWKGFQISGLLPNNLTLLSHWPIRLHMIRYTRSHSVLYIDIARRVQGHGNNFSFKFFPSTVLNLLACRWTSFRN